MAEQHNLSKIKELCNRCGGSKTIKGLGFIDTPCPECFGLGFIEKYRIKHEEIYPHGKTGEKKNSGRPKKDKDNKDNVSKEGQIPEKKAPEYKINNEKILPED